MLIYKILNNNVVVVKENNQEKVVMGRGLSFKKKVGDAIDPNQIDKIFTLNNPDTNNKFQQLLTYIPLEYIELVEEIIVYVQANIDVDLKESFYISLSDHIYSSIKRFNDGIEIKNPLLWDIQRFYIKEYELSLKVLEKINKKMNICLPKDEAGSIALHIVDAQLNNNKQDVNNMYAITKIMQEILNIVKYHFNINFDETSVHYYRFITHLKFFAQRLVTHNFYQDETDFEILETVKSKYKNEYACVLKIKDFINKEYNYSLSEEEMMYLTIHIAKIIYYK